MYSAAVFLPLIGAVIAGLLRRQIGGRGAQWVTCGAVGLSALLSLFIFNAVALQGQTQLVPVFTWIQSGALDVGWAFRYDTLTAVMVLTVSWVSFMVHLYAIGYMHEDPSPARFFSYLNLFTFFMLVLVTSNNLVQLFFGWEGVGLASYLLIGFWYTKPSANAAAIKAFIVNRVGDFGFALGIFGVFAVFNTVDFGAIFDAAPAHADTTMTIFGMEAHAMTAICLLLFLGAMGKSAQIGLHTWLPDAMEGPTPVSALIHAATMVTAGVFMVARMSPLFELSDTALAVVTFVGATTAFFAATIGCVQNDIKRIIAYSTCSQLGYMFFACGVSAYSAGIFHLVTHAFFKALLFLAAGSVIHAMSDEQNIQRMGGIWRHIKVTYVTFWIGSLALAGIPLFAGYYSKDIILEAAFAAESPVSQYAFVLGVAAAFLTAFYSWRLIFLAFHGKPRADEKVLAHVHESPPVMTGPLVFLALGSILAGMVAYGAFVGHGMEAFWGHSIAMLEEHGALEAAHHVAWWVKALPAVLAVLGIGMAWLFYIKRPAFPRALAAGFRGLYDALLNKWYFDELYDAVFVQPAFRLGRFFWHGADSELIDGVGPDGVAAACRNAAARFARAQTGYLFHYAFAMLIGVAVFATWYVIGYLG